MQNRMRAVLSRLLETTLVLIHIVQNNEKSMPLWADSSISVNGTPHREVTPPAPRMKSWEVTWQAAAKKRGGSLTLPVPLVAPTGLPASPVNPAPVVGIDDKDDEYVVLDIGNYTIVTDPIAP